MSSEKTSIGERLSRVRKRTGLSQAGMGAKLGISDRAYKNYELGIRAVPLEVVEKTCLLFDINIHWLVFDEQYMDQTTFGEVVENAVEETRMYCIESGIVLLPNKEAKIVRYLVERFQENGSLSEDAKNDFLRLSMGKENFDEE